MRNAFLVSFGLHACVIALVFAGLPELFQPEPLEETAVAVEVVTEMPKKTPEPPEPEARSEPPPPKMEKPPPPPAPPRAALPEPKPPVPEPPKREVVPEKKADPAPKPEPKKEPPPQVAKVEPSPPAPPAPRRRPKPPPDEFQTLLKNLAQEAREQRREEPEPEPKPEPEPPQQQLAEAREAPPTISDVERRRLREGLAELVKEQISPCWNIPVGAKDAHRMRIEIRISLNPDGSLRGHPRIQDTDRVNKDPFYRALAESAVRALINPRCSPLRLPQQQYEIWKEISFNFDPREVLAP